MDETEKRPIYKPYASLEIFNNIDEQGRFLGCKVAYGIRPGQSDSHTISYLHQRRMYEAAGMALAFGPESATLELVAEQAGMR